MPNKDTMRFRELVRLPRKDLALDVIGLERKVALAEECMKQTLSVIDDAFNGAADLVKKEDRPYNKVTDRLLKGLRIAKSVVEEMTWNDEQEGG